MGGGVGGGGDAFADDKKFCPSAAILANAELPAAAGLAKGAAGPGPSPGDPPIWDPGGPSWLVRVRPRFNQPLMLFEKDMAVVLFPAALAICAAVETEVDNAP